MADQTEDKSLQTGDAKILKSLAYMGLGILACVFIFAFIARFVI